MVPNIASCVLAISIAAGSNEFAGPPPNLLFQLQKQNRGHPWLRVTTESSRFTLRARRIDESGLAGINSWKSDPPAPGLLAWRSIVRIDELATHARAGKITGFIVGGAIGVGLGSTIGESIRSGPSYTDSYGTHYATGHGGPGILLGLAVLGSLGAWQGGRLGERMVRERPWYLGTRAEASTPVQLPESTSSPPALTPPAAADTLAAAILAPAAPDMVPISSEPSASPRVLRACARIGRDDLIRMRGDFGSFQGFAAVVGPRGLEELRADPHRGRHFRDAAPAGLVTWDRIDFVEKRESSWGRGAIAGGGSFFALGALVSVVAVTLKKKDASLVGAALYGGAITGSVGAVLGGLIGAAIPGWHKVYDAP